MRRCALRLHLDTLSVISRDSISLHTPVLHIASKHFYVMRFGGPIAAENALKMTLW